MGCGETGWAGVERRAVESDGTGRNVIETFKALGKSAAAIHAGQRTLNNKQLDTITLRVCSGSTTHIVNHVSLHGWIAGVDRFTCRLDTGCDLPASTT